jgi:hypothetical protein
MGLDEFREHPGNIISNVFYAGFREGLEKLRGCRSRIGSGSEFGERRILDKPRYLDGLAQEKMQRAEQVIQLDRELHSESDQPGIWKLIERERTSIDTACYVAEAIVFGKNGKRFLLRQSPLVAFPDSLKNLENFSGGELFATDEQIEMIERLRKDSENWVMLPRQTTALKIDYFCRYPVTTFLYGSSDGAREQGELLKGLGIEKVPLWLPSVRWTDEKIGDSNRPIIRQLRINGIMADAAIGGDWAGIMNSQAIFGVTYKNPLEVYEDTDFLARWVEPPGRIARLCGSESVRLYDAAIRKYGPQLLRRPDLPSDTRKYIERRRVA